MRPPKTTRKKMRTNQRMATLWECGAHGARGVAYGGGAQIRLALVAPKPKELESAWRILRGLACFGTRSMSQPSDGFSRLRVGGATWSRIASSEKIASTLPAAPRRWPMADLVEDMESL